MMQWLLTYAPVLALAASFLAVIMSTFALSWTIFRDLMLKARLRVSIGIKVIHEHGKNSPPFLDVTGTNHGPGTIPCRLMICRRKKWFKKREVAIFVTDFSHPVQTRLDKMHIGVGESVTYALWLKDLHELFTDPPDRIGIADAFGRQHFASRRDLKDLYKQWKEWQPKQKARESDSRAA